MEGFLERGVTPLLCLAWVFAGVNKQFPFMSKELGVVMGAFYCVHAGYLSFAPGLDGGLSAVCSACVAAMHLWFLHGMALPPFVFFLVLPAAIGMHVALARRRERTLALARARASAHV